MATFRDNLRSFFLGSQQNQRAATLPVRRTIDAGGYFGVLESLAGVTVNEVTALNLSAVYGCVRAISDALASLPLILYQVGGDGRKTRATGHSAFWTLKEQGNPFMTAFEVRQALFANALLWGNGFAEMDFDADGRLTALYPIRSDRVSMKFEDGALFYTVSVPNAAPVVLPAWRVHHMKVLTLDGFTGVSPLRMAANSLGLTMAAERYGAQYFGSDGNPMGLLKTPTELSEEAYERLKTNWAGGFAASHTTRILEQGLEYQSVAPPPEDVQFLSTRQFQTTEIARWFRVPPAVIGDLSNSTYSNNEQQALDFIQNCLRPLASNHEQALRRDALVGEEKRTHDIEYDFSDMLRGDTTARFEAYRTGVNNGILTVNEARRAENLAPVEGGDAFYLPLQIGKVSESGEITAPAPASSEVRSVAEVENGESRALALIETRRGLVDAEIEMRSALAEELSEPLTEIIGRSVTKTIRDIRRQLPMVSSGDVEGFFTWLRGYSDELSPYLVKALLPTLTVLFKNAMRSAARELEKEPLAFDDALREWVKGYATRYGAEFSDRTYEQLFALVGEATETDTGTAIDGRLTEWETDGHRAEKEAKSESVNFVSAATIAAYAGHGVARVIWVTNAGACALCAQMDGRTTSIHGSFVKKGDQLDSGEEGADAVTFQRDYRHPPLHDKCTCGVKADG